MAFKYLNVRNLFQNRTYAFQKKTMAKIAEIQIRLHLNCAVKLLAADNDRSLNVKPNDGLFFGRVFMKTVQDLTWINKLTRG